MNEINVDINEHLDLERITNAVSNLSYYTLTKPITVDNINCLTPNYGRFTPTIKSYEEAMKFSTQANEVTIKSEVLKQIIDRIKELEETNAKNWAELLKENV